jgi:hypothetical protein
VPPDQEHAHQRNDDRHEREDLEHHLPADRLQQLGRSAHRDDSSVAADRPAQVGQVFWCVVQVLALCGLDEHQQRRAEQPPRQADAFPPEHEPQESARPGHGATFAATVCSSP